MTTRIPVYRYIGTKEERETVEIGFPAQHQDCRPGLESLMEPKPISENTGKNREGKLSGKTALITGGDSGVGRAVAYAFAAEGAGVTIAYLCEREDAGETKRRVEEMGRRCLLIPGDLKKEENCKKAAEDTVKDTVKEIFQSGNGLYPIYDRRDAFRG